MIEVEPQVEVPQDVRPDDSIEGNGDRGAKPARDLHADVHVSKANPPEEQVGGAIRDDFNRTLEILDRPRSLRDAHPVRGDLTGVRLREGLHDVESRRARVEREVVACGSTDLGVHQRQALIDLGGQHGERGILKHRFRRPSGEHFDPLVPIIDVHDVSEEEVVTEDALQRAAEDRNRERGDVLRLQGADAHLADGRVLEDDTPRKSACHRSLE